MQAYVVCGSLLVRWLPVAPGVLRRMRHQSLCLSSKPVAWGSFNDWLNTHYCHVGNIYSVGPWGVAPNEAPKLWVSLEGLQAGDGSSGFTIPFNSNLLELPHLKVVAKRSEPVKLQLQLLEGSSDHVSHLAHTQHCCGTHFKVPKGLPASISISNVTYPA